MALWAATNIQASSISSISGNTCDSAFEEFCSLCRQDFPHFMIMIKGVIKLGYKYHELRLFGLTDGLLRGKIRQHRIRGHLHALTYLIGQPFYSTYAVKEFVKLVLPNSSFFYFNILST